MNVHFVLKFNIVTFQRKTNQNMTDNKYRYD
jgi:hypothetical protein